MDKRRNRNYNLINNPFTGEVKLMSLTQLKANCSDEKAMKTPNGVKQTNKLVSARDIAKEIGLRGAFGVSLADLHKQGR